MGLLERQNPSVVFQEIYKTETLDLGSNNQHLTKLKILTFHAHMHRDVLMLVRRQLVGIGSLLTSYRNQGWSSSGHG